jgi:hypothetical protein
MTATNMTITYSMMQDKVMTIRSTTTSIDLDEDIICIGRVGMSYNGCEMSSNRGRRYL